MFKLRKLFACIIVYTPMLGHHLVLLLVQSLDSLVTELHVWMHAAHAGIAGAWVPLIMLRHVRVLALATNIHLLKLLIEPRIIRTIVTLNLTKIMMLRILLSSLFFT